MKQQYAAALLERRRRQVASLAVVNKTPNTGTSEASAQALDLLTWTIVHRRNLIPERPFDLVHHAYLADIYNCTAQQLVLSKAGQMGASEYLISYALHAADQRNATVLYVLPTDKGVSAFSAARIGPAIEASDYLKSIIIDGGAPGDKHGADRVTLKRVRNRFIYLRGAQVDPNGLANQLKTVDGDALVLDEEDEMDVRAIPIAEKRLGHSTIAEIRKVSTPTYAGRGIHAEYARSDQREWFVRCGHCGEWQVMTIQAVVMEWDQLDRPVRWHGQKDNRAYVACHKCGREIDRLGRGQWVARRPGVEIAGFHITKFFSATADLFKIVQTLQEVDETKRRECFNQDLGEPYSPRGGKLTDELLDRCRRQYALGQRPGERTVMGVDVGDSIHYGVIRGPIDVERGEYPQRFAGTIDSFEEIGRLMRIFNVEHLVIDCRPETTKARELQASFPPGVVWLAEYPPHGLKTVEPFVWDHNDQMVSIDRTRALDGLYADLLAGALTLPADARDVPHYYKHLKAPTRVIEQTRDGTGVARYVEDGPDHLAHAENYCRIAFFAPVVSDETVYDEETRVEIGY